MKSAKDRIMKFVERTGETDSFEIAMLLLIPIEDVNKALEEINDEGSIKLSDG